MQKYDYRLKDIYLNKKCTWIRILELPSLDTIYSIHYIKYKTWNLDRKNIFFYNIQNKLQVKFVNIIRCFLTDKKFLGTPNRYDSFRTLVWIYSSKLFSYFFRLYLKKWIVTKIKKIFVRILFENHFVI